MDVKFSIYVHAYACTYLYAHTAYILAKLVYFLLYDFKLNEKFKSFKSL